MGEALLSRSTPLATLVRIKDYAGALAHREGARPGRRIEYAVALTLYYAGIAGALLFHGKTIEGKSRGALAEGFGKLIDKAWAPPALSRHFAEACKACGGE